MKLLAALGAAVLVGTPIVVALLVHRSGTGATAPPPSGPNAPFPAPPPGAVVYSRQLGSYALALGVVPNARNVTVQASVVDGEGGGVAGLAVAFTVGGATRAASPCGPGCYRATVPVPKRPRAVDVALRGTAAGHWHVALPASWPPPDATPLVARADRAWRALRSLAFSEDIASDPVHRVSSTWTVEAPDRLTYRIKGGWSAVIIGDRRWDRPPGGRWRASPQSPIRQPVPSWASVVDAHVLGKAQVRGRPAWKVSFFDPTTRAWFTIALDRRNVRTLDIHMTATAHFMHDVYSRFDEPVSIRPPR
jgi:hypothetical protein